MTIDYTGCLIQAVSAHKVGNKTNEEELVCSKTPLQLEDNTIRDLLKTYFLSHFKSPEFYAFTFSNGDFGMNPLYNFACKMFDEPESFHDQSVYLAKHLYETSLHPNIKSGDFFVASFQDLIIDDEVCDAIGLFKAETVSSFIKLEPGTEKYHIHYDHGVNVEKMDKGCLIYNSERHQGFKISIIDRLNRSGEAHFWKELFLNVKPLADDFHHTANFMNLAKTFVTKQLKEEFEVDKADEADLLNKSLKYFKENEALDEDDFGAKIFNDEKVIESFQNFKETYQTEKEVEISGSFDISGAAVKQKNKFFKSVIKLDKNFHIYIHGDKNKVEKGTDDDGRKYYKLFYDKEH